MLLGPLQCDLSGDLLAKLEAFERNLSQYGQSSGEVMSDSVRIGAVNRVTDTELTTHLVANAEKVLCMSEVQTQGCGLIESKASRGTKEGVLGQSGMSQMDAEAPKEQRKSHSGRTGHLAKDGRQNKSGKVTSEKGKEERKAEAREARGAREAAQGRVGVQCWKCGQYRHVSRTCERPNGLCEIDFELQPFAATMKPPP